TGCWCGTSSGDPGSPGPPSDCSTLCWARAWSSTPTGRPRRPPPAVPPLPRQPGRSRTLRRADPLLPELPGVLSAEQVRRTVASIAAEQERDGALPWFRGGQLDVWDSVEAAMALDVGGEHRR